MSWMFVYFQMKVIVTQASEEMVLPYNNTLDVKGSLKMKLLVFHMVVKALSDENITPQSAMEQMKAEARCQRGSVVCFVCMHVCVLFVLAVLTLVSLITNSPCDGLQ